MKKGFYGIGIAFPDVEIPMAAAHERRLTKLLRCL
jgi:hypothetical protein